MLTQNPRRAAFTLVELLVVIAIVALLISMLLPSLSKSRDTARNLQCAAGARGVGFAIDAYANDWKNYIVSNNPDTYAATVTATTASIGYPLGSYTTRNYAGVLTDLGYTNAMLYTNRGGCPYGPRPSQLNLTWWGNDYYSDTTLTSISYGMPGVLQGGFGFGLPYVSPYYRPNGRSRRDRGRIAVQGPSRNVYATCSVTPWGINSGYPGVALFHTLGVRTSYTVTLEGPTSSGFRERRHEGTGLPMVAADGHGEFVLTRTITNVSSATAIYWPSDTIMGSFSWRHNYNNSWYAPPIQD